MKNERRESCHGAFIYSHSSSDGSLIAFFATLIYVCSLGGSSARVGGGNIDIHAAERTFVFISIPSLEANLPEITLARKLFNAGLYVCSFAFRHKFG
jgi:hypothetical protein